MPTTPKNASKRLVAERLRARRQRVAGIRKRVLAGTAATFVLAWGVIFAQLVSGHDPALAKKSTVSTSASQTSSSTSSGSAGTASTGSTNSSASGTGSGSTGAVTTSQS